MAGCVSPKLPPPPRIPVPKEGSGWRIPLQHVPHSRGDGSPASWAPVDPALAGVTCYSGRIHQALDGATHLYGVGNLERKELWKHHRAWGFLPKAGRKAGCGISTCIYIYIYDPDVYVCTYT